MCKYKHIGTDICIRPKGKYFDMAASQIVFYTGLTHFSTIRYILRTAGGV